MKNTPKAAMSAPSSRSALDEKLTANNLTLRKLARRVNRSEAYLLQLWRKGRAPQPLAEKLAKHLQVPSQVFLWGWPHHNRHFNGANTYQAKRNRA